MTDLPESVTRVAFRSSNGEYAWRRAHIVDALQAIAASQQAILGGEVWVVKEGRVWGVVPSRTGEPPGVWHWSTSLRRSGEPWADYCRRVAEESVRAVEGLNVEAEAREDVLDSLYYNLTYIEEPSHKNR